MFENVLKVNREDGFITIRISEDGIINSAKYHGNIVKNKDVFFEKLIEKIKTEESNFGYGDSLEIFKLIDGFVEDIYCFDDVDEECFIHNDD